MKKLLFLLAFVCIGKCIQAQTRPPYIYTIKADSVLITNSCDTAELILENHTQNVPGFLFNKGRGRTEFRRVLQKINDSIFLVGADSLKLTNIWLQGGNAFGTTGILGTRDNNHLDFYTNNIKRARLDSIGRFSLDFPTGLSIDPFSLTTGSGAKKWFYIHGDIGHTYISLSTLNDNAGALECMRLTGGGETSTIETFAYSDLSVRAFGGLDLYGGYGGGATKYIRFFPAGILAGAFSANGNLLLGNTSTDNGNKLQVTGNSNITGAFSVGGTFTQAAPQTAIFGNGIAFSSSGNMAEISCANNGMYYHSNSTGDQHLFQNTIGSNFTGNLVTIDPGYYPQLLDNQLALKVFARMNMPGLAVNMAGYTGIGTFTPSAQLHTTGTVRFAGLTNNDSLSRVIVSDANGNLYYRNASSLVMNDILNSDLAVTGTFSAPTMKITQAGAWPDYVFSRQYKLPTLLQLEQYIKQNNHLPDVPSAAEVDKKGIDVGNNEATLLKKIEELTLYVIEQEKKLQKQNEEIAEMKGQLKTLMQKN